jgi:hypothetical protein
MFVRGVSPPISELKAVEALLARYCKGGWAFCITENFLTISSGLNLYRSYVICVTHEIFMSIKFSSLSVFTGCPALKVALGWTLGETGWLVPNKFDDTKAQIPRLMHPSD